MFLRAVTTRLWSAFVVDVYKRQIFLVRALETGLNRFPQISSYYISLVWGAVLLLVMVLDYLNEHKRIKA